MNKPTIIHEVQNDEELILSIEIPDSILYFQGHFPEHPILPGVVQVHWAEHFGRRYFKNLAQFSRLEKIKFHAIITPNIQMDLILTHKESIKKLLFCYQTDQQKYSSGCIVLDRE